MKGLPTAGLVTGHTCTIGSLGLVPPLLTDIARLRKITTKGRVNSSEQVTVEDKKNSITHSLFVLVTFFSKLL
jgi:hypothetical protein